MCTQIAKSQKRNLDPQYATGNIQQGLFASLLLHNTNCIMVRAMGEKKNPPELLLYHMCAVSNEFGLKSLFYQDLFILFPLLKRGERKPFGELSPKGIQPPQHE